MVKTKKKTFECEDCGKELKNARSLAGHMWFAHQKRYGVVPNLKEEIKLLQEEKGTNPDTIERIENIEDSVKELTAMIKDLMAMVKRIVELIPGTSNPGNPGNPGKTEKKTDDDDKLPDIITPILEWLFGSDKDKSDDEKKSEEKDDDDSIFL